MNERILIVDDEPDILHTLDSILTKEGFRVECVSGGEEAIERFRSEPFDLLITDIRMSGMDGLELMRLVKKMTEEVEVIILTGYATIDNAVRALKDDGAFDFLTKPLENVDKLFITVNQALEKRQLRIENRALVKELQQTNDKLNRRVEELERAEEEIRRAKEEWERTFNSIDDIVTIQDLQMRIVRMNRAAEEALKSQSEEPIGKHCYEVFLGTSEPCQGCPELKSIQNGQSYSAEIEHPSLNKTFLVSASPIFDRSGELTGIVHRYKDITERRQLEAQLRQTQKMEAIGTLLGGIAHEFNNLLQSVQGYADLLLLDKGQNEPGYRELQEIINAAQRGAELTHQLLTFSRTVESRKRPVDLNRKVEQSKKLLDKAIPKTINIELLLADELKTINADPAQIEQILINLAVNAKEAMPECGKLIIETENVTLDEEYGEAHPGVEPGDYVLIAVSDTGRGMDNETLVHIFEPFYTTRGLAEATGLGLPVVYGIVKEHGGHIMCHSEPGVGTTFKIYLPAAEKEAEGLSEKEAVPGGTETILLVDDEESLRELAGKMLSRYGYRVLTAGNGREALELFRRETRRISLVILDLIMPEMGGMKCLKELLRLNPQAKVLIASGYPEVESVKKTMEAGAIGHINKPYNMREMLKAVREVLDEN